MQNHEAYRYIHKYISIQHIYIYAYSLRVELAHDPAKTARAVGSDALQVSSR